MSKETKWTRGPWNVQPLTKAFGVYDQQGTQVARVGNAYGVATEHRKADARLIAAAPDLAEAAHAAYVLLANIHNEWPGRNTLAGQHTLCLLRDVIAKAHGIDPQDVQDAASVVRGES